MSGFIDSLSEMSPNKKFDGVKSGDLVEYLIHCLINTIFKKMVDLPYPLNDFVAERLTVWNSHREYNTRFLNSMRFTHTFMKLSFHCKFYGSCTKKIKKNIFSFGTMALKFVLF